ncbi:metal-dependent transcriptional regulator [Deminuibacter soli]|uniref:Transcriptional regulator MntR n=1 Tax=Deminuibacter soli TaxID=2291815 RepID=A0A3E1NLS2_9BACT|nr:metal-dependent transcriptional regulator [Deminuibacter soli]RFM28867.1 metal-dependent transcriptional regulator [Deminuibacter soli]
MQPNFTVAEENHIKAIYHLQQLSGKVFTNDLAAALETRPASVTDMLKKLKAKKILHYEPYQGFYLNSEGKKIALGIIRKHRLWEYFLVEKLHFGWDEVHEVAEQLEHINSKKLIDKLDAFLDYPRFDPHGDPIPDSNGKMAAQQQVNLTQLDVNQQAEICAVASQARGLLELLKHSNIGIGTKLEIKRRFGFDQSVEITIKNQQTMMLSHQVAQALFVKII